MLLVVLLLVVALVLALLAIALPAFYLLIFAALLLLAAALAGRQSQVVADRANSADEAAAVGIELIAVIVTSVLIVIIVLASLAIGHVRSSPGQRALLPPTVVVTLTASPSPPALAPRASPHTTVTKTVTPAPSVTVPAPPTGRWYETVRINVPLRTAPSTSAPIVVTITAFGSWVNLACYEVGDTVFGDPYWYRASFNGETGYVSAFWTDTGDDLARAGVHAC